MSERAATVRGTRIIELRSKIHSVKAVARFLCERRLFQLPKNPL